MNRSDVQSRTLKKICSKLKRVLARPKVQARPPHHGFKARQLLFRLLLELRFLLLLLGRFLLRSLFRLLRGSSPTFEF